MTSQSRRSNAPGAGISRRAFLAMSAASSAVGLTGCATNPVSGRRQLMLVSERQEIEMDQQWAPHQFSNDYGVSQDAALNAYIEGMGRSLVGHTHRPNMPYSFRAVNGVIANAYTMPGGSVAVCRGLLVELKDESELAAVLGHELGHVNARHTAEQMSKNLLVSVAVAGIAAYVEHEKEEYAALAAGLGGIGANALLARYSRDDEREADGLGMLYMVRAGHNPQGMAGIMATFMEMRRARPGAVDLLFSTHPLSEDRHAAAVARSDTKYAGMHHLPVYRERYMDNTARLRAVRDALVAMQNGEKSMRAERFTDAQEEFTEALRIAPDDYAGLLMMTKCQMAQGRSSEAKRYLDRARAVYPGEPQADHLAGVQGLKARRFGAALAAFESYEGKLPGNPNTMFFKAVALDGMGRREAAAAEYTRYCRAAPSGEFSETAHRRLVEWGHVPDTER